MAAFPRLAAVRQPPPPLSPDRAALAAAIDAWRTAQDEVAAITRAVDVARTAHSDARTKLDEAEAAVDAAKTAMADHLTDTAMGTHNAPPRTIKQSRTALIDAEDDADVAKAALDALKARLDTAQQHLANCTIDREQALRAMLKASPEVAALLAEVEKLQTELVSKGAALSFLWKNHALSLGMPGLASYQGDTAADLALMRLRSPPSSWHALHNDIVPAREAPYRAWLSALLTDASAPLPGVPA
jgi:hypothetical protein